MMIGDTVKRLVIYPNGFKAFLAYKSDVFGKLLSFAILRN